ncbi:MAG: ABC transporter ATP-binding protein/permease [Firmicutes bacterium]|nr:ABC transporter ATP-binding protein/permease [Bacillota bacterium]
MIQLRNVSKYYYSKGLIASGISKVNLEFDLGEFVVITGESGSGKTTLLNVISGLDSYEEGEMYIDGQETSHYLAADFEEYRKKYIGNIFQHFNLINSYTVYQNVELILLVNGYKGKEIRSRVREIIDRVGLSEFRNTKVSKLSGGQRQRVSIARALAKDTDIIVADEPTGNLDSESAEGICQLLSEISRDKLVIVVTHNYDQFANYATRRVKMHDGKVIENVDLRIREQLDTTWGLQKAGRISAFSKLRLGIRNTFNIFYKFLLLLIVFLFLVFAVASQYTTFINERYESDSLGYNSYFANYSDKRIVLTKQEKAEFGDEDYKALINLDNVQSVIMNDVLLDTSLYIENELFSYETYPRDIREFRGELTAGRLPEADNEVVISGESDEYSFSEDMMDVVLDQEFKIYVGEDGEVMVRVVGVSFDNDLNTANYSGNLFMSDNMIRKLLTMTYSYGSNVTTTINGKEVEYTQGDPLYRLMPSDKVAKGNAVLSEEVDNFYVDPNSEKEIKAKGHDISVKVKNMFYEDGLNLKIADTYDDKTFSKLTGRDDFDTYAGAIFISQADFDQLFAKGNYQCSVYIKEPKKLDETNAAIRALGYKTLPLKDTIVVEGQDVQDMIRVPITILIILAIFCIAYLVAGLILRSRTTYFSILRMLGMARRDIRRILDVEILLVMNIAFAIFLATVYVVQQGYLKIPYLKTLVDYMTVRDYIILYVLTGFMAFLISGWFSRRLFKKTAMGSFREEV